MKKIRILAALLALAICLTIMPVTVFAADPEFNPDDIAAINAIASAHPSLGMSEAPPDGSEVPDDWTGKVNWFTATNNRRVFSLILRNKGMTGALDVSGLPSLNYLFCENNHLTELNLSGLTGLADLNCSGNQLTELNLSGLTRLNTLNCSGNQLTELDLSGLTRLAGLNCSGNQLTELNLSGITGLTDLYCSGNQLTELDLHNFFLFNADVSFNCMESADDITNVSNIIRWDALYYKFFPQRARYAVTYEANGGGGTMNPNPDTAFEELPFELPECGFEAPAEANNFKYWAIGSADSATTKNPGETYTFTDNTEVFAVWDYPEFNPDDIAAINAIAAAHPSLEMSQAPPDGSEVPDDWDGIVDWNGDLPKRVEFLTISDLGLSGTLKLSGLEKLICLECYSNELTGLNLSDLPALRDLGCAKNNLTGTLDLRNLTNLRSLEAEHNNLSFIDVRNLAHLTTLICVDNELTGFDASGTDLTELRCENNLLTELDLSDFESLIYLDCSDNLLTSVKLNPDATYSSGIDVRNNYLPDKSAVTGKDGISWDTGDPVKYKFLPQKATYTVTYNANGGGGSMAPGKAFQDIPFTLPANGFTAPAGKQFVSWAIGSPSSPKVYPGGKYIFNRNTIVYAVWSDVLPPNTYFVTVINGSANAATAKTGVVVTITADPAQEGYRFKGWSVYPPTVFVYGTNPESPTAHIIMPAGDVIAEAKYEIYDNYAENYSGGGIGGGKIGGSGGAGPVVTPIPDPEPEPVVDPTEPIIDPIIPTEPEPEIPAEPEAAPAFSDVSETDWFAGAVAYVARRGIMQGTGDGLFSPNAPVTRAMLVTMLYRLDGSPEVSAQIPFTDVEPGSWYYPAVCWAYENGIILGISDTEFGANLDITREQLVTILYRYALKRGLVCEYGVTLDEFADKDQISPWAVEAMLWAKAEGIISGVSEDTLDPQGAATRAQIAAIFQRFMENITG